MIAGWIGLLVGIGVLAQVVGGETDDAFSIPGTESQRALDLLDEKFPGTGGASARIVFAAPDGRKLTEERYEDVGDPTVGLARKVPQTVGEVTGQRSLRFSKDERIAFADLNFAVPVDDLTDETKDALERVAEPARRAGLEVAFSGGVIATSEGGGTTEVLGFIVAFLVLLVTFRALLAAGLPLLTAVIGIVITLTGITALTGVISLNSTAPTLALMLGLAVGIDYALFILSRHRQHLAEGHEPIEASARALATAGSAVVFAGLTVFIALAGLTVVGIPFLSVMGLAAAGAVVVAVLIALTLVPALMTAGGQRLAKGRIATRESGFGMRWARWVTGRPLLAILGVVGVLGAIAIPATDMRLGLPDDSTAPADSTERRSFELLTEGFGPGFTGPLTIVTEIPPQMSDPERVHERVADALRGAPDVAAASPPRLNDDARVSIIQVTPESAPASQRTKDLVSLIRERAEDAAERYDVNVYVTGTTAINIDTSDKLTSALPVFLILIVGVALLLMALVFRSLLVPIKAALGFLLTIAAALGGVTWIFQEGNLSSVFGIQSTSPIVSFLPVLMIAILFGLAMDYEVFLVSRMRESYTHSRQALQSTVDGFAASARVVTAAALIMIAVFGGFILGDDLVVKSIGFALAFGVLADAFLVRMTLVPAVLALLGERAWSLPGWLDRRLPSVDIEGTALERTLPPATAERRS